MVILSVKVKNKSIYWKNQIFHCPPTIFHWWKIFLPSRFRLVLIRAIPHLNCNQIASYSQLPLPDLNLLVWFDRPISPPNLQYQSVQRCIYQESTTPTQGWNIININIYHLYIVSLNGLSLRNYYGLILARFFTTLRVSWCLVSSLPN